MKDYRYTTYACYLGYVVQAIINNFVPLLFLTFHSEYGIPMWKITFLVTFNFGLQLLIDLLSAYFVDRIGYRASMVIACGAAALGLSLLTVLPDLFPDHFIGIIICIIIYAVGGGLTEVLISPIIESCPSEHKEAAMSMLHAMYSWGSVIVVLVSTLFFTFVGISHWRTMALLWTIVPVVTLIMFLFVPIAPLVPEGETQMSLAQLFSNRLIFILLLMMVCAGASEQAVSQWASTFAESALHVSKTMGDLMGPMFFSIMFGISRTLYGVLGKRMDLMRFFKFSVGLCVVSYIIVVASPLPIISLIGCGLVGFSVGIFWPGTFSFASAGFPAGGTMMFSFLALAGDIGCAGGPTLAGLVSSAFGDSLKIGILAAIIFPILMGVMCTAYLKLTKQQDGSEN
mgnify:CR=1 FL=1